MSTLRVGNITATGGTGTITVPTGNQISQVDRPSGLVLVTTASFSNSALQVNNCFSSEFTNYRIVAHLRGSGSGGVTVWMRLSKGGATSNAGYFSLTTFSTSSAGPSRDYQNNVNTGWWSATVGDLAPDGSTIDIFEPFVGTARTTATSVGVCFSSTTAWNVTSSHYHSTTDSYDGFNMYPNTGSCSGTVRVYGYRNS